MTASPRARAAPAMARGLRGIPTRWGQGAPDLAAPAPRRQCVAGAGGLYPCTVAIIVHHLMHSRSLRVLWLLEELGLEYELVRYERDANFRAPPSLERAHPLGRAPVVEVDGQVLA